MATTSYPHADSTVSESQHRQFFRLASIGGVVGDVADLLEVSAGSGLSVDVAAGRGLVDGFVFDQTTSENKTLAVADGSNDRIDTVLLRYDPAGGAGGTSGIVTLQVKGGTAAASPVPPTLTQVADGIWEEPLADVLVTAAGSTVAPDDVTDRRRFTRGGRLDVGPISETVTDLGTISGAQTIDLADGSIFECVLSGSTTFTVIGRPPAGRKSAFTLIVDNAGGYAVTWEAGTVHPNGVPPALNGVAYLSGLASASTLAVGVAWEEVA